MSRGRQKVRLAIGMAGRLGATRTSFLKLLFLVITSFYLDPLFRNNIFLDQKYVVEELSARKFAREIFSSRMAVLAGLALCEIQIREAHFHNGHPSQPRYGQKYQRDMS